MSVVSRLFRGCVLLIVLINFLVCPYVFIGTMFFPQAIKFLEPTLCPDGMQLETVTRQVSDREGTYTRANVICEDKYQEKDITGRVMLVMLGFPAVGFVLLLLIPFSSKKNQDEPIILKGED